jgi:phage regulator Rha-like protein
MASENNLMTPVEHLTQLIHEIRGQKVILDRDLARLYGVETKNLNKAVRRNLDRFPADFMFQITFEEAHACLGSRFQFGTLKRGKNIKYLPYAFTEHGAIMAANVLNSPRAAQMSVFVVRAFVKMRAALSDNRDLARKLAALEKELKNRLNVHEAAIVTILQRVMAIIDPPALPEPPKKRIGFQVKEAHNRYVTRRKGNHGLGGKPVCRQLRRHTNPY